MLVLVFRHPSSLFQAYVCGRVKKFVCLSGFTPPSQRLEGALFVDKDVYDQSLLCMWNVKNTMCQRIQLLDLNIPDLDELEEGASILTRQDIAIPHSTPMLQVRGCDL